MVGRVAEARTVHEDGRAAGAQLGLAQVVAFSENGLGLVARRRRKAAAPAP